MKKRTSNIIFLTVIVILIAVSSNWIWNEYKMKNYEIVCAKFVSTFKSKSYWNYTFEYKADGIKHSTSRRGKDYSSYMKKYLNSKECFEIAYSKYDNSCFRILDNKIGTDWLWFLDENDE